MGGAASRRGLWITFEGIEGSGKSTQIERLASRLRESALRTVVTREPGGTELGRVLRDLLLRPAPEPMAPLTELLLYAADRAQHLTEIVLPALERGEIVLCDRFLDATLAYQGYGRRLGVERVLELHRHAPLDRRPDRTILLDLQPESGLRRARSRDRESGKDRSAGRFEQERLEFHRRVRCGYLELAAAEPSRFRVIDADRDLDQLTSRVRRCLADLLPCLAEPGEDDGGSAGG